MGPMNEKKSFIQLYKDPPAFLALLKLFVFVYLFLFSLELMGTSLKMFGRGLAESLIQTTSNPLVGLFIGILATSIIQSSSSTTSIVVGMVSGGALTVSNAIPIIMGANIGTSVTNLLVSLAHINRRVEFQRAFSAAIVHDFFNVLSVLVFFPLQYYTNFLGWSATLLGEQFQNIGGLKLLSPVKALTHPLVDVFKSIIGPHPWILFPLSLIILILSLTQMVGALKSLVIKKAAAWFDRYLFKTPWRALFVGLILTALVQSSSITTSLVVPMAGAGLLTITQIFPYTLGANIGTTVIAILAALATQNLAAVVVAFSHLLFNISGMVFWWPLKKVPISLAQKFSEMSMRYRYFPVIYVIIVFFIIPGLIITLLR